MKLIVVGSHRTRDRTCTWPLARTKQTRCGWLHRSWKGFHFALIHQWFSNEKFVSLEIKLMQKLFLFKVRRKSKPSEFHMIMARWCIMGRRPSVPMEPPKLCSPVIPTSSTPLGSGNGFPSSTFKSSTRHTVKVSICWDRWNLKGVNNLKIR